ncbi:MAG TPA: cupin domain-containing protein [Treponemataceae bacterium]|nr:cupin domain-containing protein [Treponemataceae bacterium]
MKTKECFEKGMINCSGKELDIESMKWNEHKTFKGVYLKHLLTGSDTRGVFSAHFVKIDAGCEIGLHTHEQSDELHEVIDGKGTCLLGDKIQDYSCGVISLIPKTLPHRVRAGKEGLFIFAKFFPPLV